MYELFILISVKIQLTENDISKIVFLKMSFLLLQEYQAFQAPQAAASKQACTDFKIQKFFHDTTASRWLK